jgi:hypothetical protein
MRGYANVLTVLAVLSLSLEGCVSTRTASVADGSASAMHGKSLIVSHREKPDFGAMTAGKMMFGVLGAAAIISAGNKIVADNQIEDPAVDVGRQLSQALGEKYGLTATASVGPLADTADTNKLANIYAGSDFVLDVQTVNSSFVYRPNLTHYRVLYSVKIRLIDTRQAKLLAEAFCYRKDDDDKSPPTHGDPCLSMLPVA